MRWIFSSAVLISLPCQPPEAPPAEVDTLLADPGAAAALAAPALAEGFRQVVAEVFQEPERYRWVWTTPADRNAVVQLYRSLVDLGTPEPLARLSAWSAATPATAQPQLTLAPEGPAEALLAAAGTQDWPVPTQIATAVLARAAAIPCVAAAEAGPTLPAPVGPAPPALACRALERWAR